MLRRTTIEIDDDLLRRAQRALGSRTVRQTVEEALRRAAAALELEREERGNRQREYLDRLGSHAELAVLASEEMWS